MGGPTSGTLALAGLRVEGCSPSLAWSDDSRLLAVPQWTPDKAQRLLLVDPAAGSVRTLPGTYRVLELRSFRGGVLEGTDSPRHRPAPLRLDLNGAL